MMQSLLSVLFILSTVIYNGCAADVHIESNFDQGILLEETIPSEGDDSTPKILETPKFDPVFLD
jgi:hypothetical protein